LHYGLFDIMDAALELQIGLDSNESLSPDDALNKLNQSDLVKRLTSNMVEKPLFYIWRLIALSEIPYAQYLDYTNNLIDRIYERLSTPFGFSLSGDEKSFLPCYNAMLVSAMCKLGQSDNRTVLSAIEWISRYQPMERGVEVSVPNLKFEKYGGCFNNTPCYIGLAKSVFALFEYQQVTGDKNANQQLEKGIEYLLQHQLVKRLHKDSPITQHIMDISFPESYHLNIVELIRFVGRANLLEDSRAKYAVQYLENLQTNDGCWKINYRYRADGYTVFDKGRKSGDWVTYVIKKALNNN